MIIKNLIAVEPTTECLEHALRSTSNSNFTFIIFNEKVHDWLRREAIDSQLLSQHINNFYSASKFLDTFSQSTTARIITPQQMMLITLATLQQLQPSAMLYAQHYNQIIYNFYQEHPQHWPYHNDSLPNNLRHGNIIKMHIELMQQADLIPASVAQIQQLKGLNNVELDTVLYIRTQSQPELLTLLQQSAHSKSTYQITPEESSIEAYEWNSSISELLYIESFNKQPGTIVISADDKFKEMQAAYQINSATNCRIKAIGYLITTSKISLLELREFLVQYQLDDNTILALQNYLHNLNNAADSSIPIINKLLKLRLMFHNKANFFDIFTGHLNLAKETNNIEVDNIINDIGALQPNINANNYTITIDNILGTYRATHSFSLHEACEAPGKIFIIQGANQKNWPEDMLANLQLLRTRGRLIFTRALCEQGLAQEPINALSALKISFSSKKNNISAQPTQRPNPQPELAIRPRNISISGLELLIRDPYSYYARYILRLRSKERESLYAKEFGIMIHHLLAMVQQAELTNSFADFKELVLSKYATMQPVEDEVMRRRIINLLPDLYSLLTEFKLGLKKSLIEVESSREFMLDENNYFKVKARSDRVDYMDHSGVRIIDYKSGTSPTQSEVDKGLYPQLPVEALIHGGDNISLIYVGVNGKLDKHTINSIALDADTTMNSLLELITMFLKNKNIGYFAVSDHDYKTKDYALLSRVEEWRHEI